jgi:hypothetical protein
MSTTFQGKAPGFTGASLAATVIAGDRKLPLFRDIAIGADGAFRAEVADDVVKPALDALAATASATVLLEARRAADVRQRSLPARSLQAPARLPRVYDLGSLEFPKTDDIPSRPEPADVPEVERLRTALTERDRLIESHTAALGTITAERDELKAQVDLVTGQSNDLKARLAARDTEVVRLNTALSDKDRKIKTLQDSLAAAAAPAPAVPLSTVLEGLRSQVETAATSDVPGNRWQLSDVRMSLKMLFEDDGTKVRLPKAGEAIGRGAHISALDFALRPGRGPARNQLKAPDVTGYTSLVAARKLQEAGFTVETSYETVVDEPGKPKRAGLVVGQRPAAGTLVEPGTSVEILIGKA